MLCAFQKTKELQPEQEAELKLTFDIRQFGSFDDTGAVERFAFVLEQGEYTVHMGVNVRDTEKALTFTLEEDRILRRCKGYMAPTKLPRRLRADGSYEALPEAPKYPHPIRRYKLKNTEPAKISLARALEIHNLDGFMAGLSDEYLADLLYGHAVTNAANCAGIGLQPRESWPV